MDKMGKKKMPELFEIEVKAHKQAEREIAKESLKVDRFKKAIANLCLDAREKRGYSIFEIKDSFYVASGKDAEKEDARSDLVKKFQEVIEAFKKDIKNENLFRIEVINVASDLNFSTLDKLL